MFSGLATSFVKRSCSCINNQLFNFISWKWRDFLIDLLYDEPPFPLVPHQMILKSFNSSDPHHALNDSSLACV